MNTITLAKSVLSKVQGGRVAIVIVVAPDQATGEIHVMSGSYGKTKAECTAAAAIMNKAHEAVMGFIGAEKSNTRELPTPTSGD